MCVSPYKIKNPIYGRSSFTLENGYLRVRDKRLTLQRSLIDVPCGTCPECRQVYYDSLFQRAIVESQSSYMYFVTLTYDNKHIPHILLPNGTDVYYFEYEHIKDMFKRLRNHNVIEREFRYLCVNEYGDNRCRPHAHLLIFIAKDDADTVTTPVFYERLLFDNLHKYFAVNVGTRKQPVYECLFTYAVKYTVTGIKTNYFVKYIDPAVNTEYNDSDTSVSFAKTIRYLIGYVNKGSKFDEYISKCLSSVEDAVLKRKLSSLLRSKVRYSKCFGNGFIDAHTKVDMPLINVHLSYFTYLYSSVMDSLPGSFSEFIEEYPKEEVNISMLLILMSKTDTDSLRKFISDLNEVQCFTLVAIMKYFPVYFNHFYRCKFRVSDLSHISYFFNKPLSYSKTIVRTFDYEDTPTFRYIRSCVDAGLNHRLPFLAFVDETIPIYMPLCKYYRDRCTTDADIDALLTVNGVRTLDELIDKYDRYLTNKKANKQKGNQATHHRDPIQYATGLTPPVTDLFSKLFINC